MVALRQIVGKVISGEWGIDDDDGTGIPVLRTTNFTNEGTIDYSDICTRKIAKSNLSDKYLRYGDIIIEKSGGSDKQPVGRVVFFDGENDTYLFNNFTGVLRISDSNYWHAKYVFYSLFAGYLQGQTRKYQNKTTGLHNLQTDAYVNDFQIPDILLENQIHIVAVLDKVSELIALRKKQLAKLDELVKSRFIEMFGDPVENPISWQTTPLLEMGYCKNGMNFHADDSGIEMHCLGVGDFKDRSVIDGTKDLPTISLSEQPSEESLLQDGDIVFVRSNGNKSLVGRCLVVFPHETPTTYSGFCIRYRMTTNKMNTHFLLHVLKTESIRKKMSGRGANIQNLNQQTLASLDIPTPPMELQEQFAAFVEQTDKLKTEVKEALEKLETLKKASMQKYFG